MDEVWQDAPVAALRVTRGAGMPAVEPNGFARAWGDAHGTGAADWQRVAVEQLALPAGERLVSVGPGSVTMTCRSVTLPDGLLLWLMPHAAADPVGGDRLALLQAFGRVGLYVRELDTGQARWDRAMFELTGLDPAAGAPSWDDFLQRCVHPEDRAMLAAHFEHARAAGARGDVHYRIVRPDGVVRLMHSLYDFRAAVGGRGPRTLGVLVDDSEAGRRLQQTERSRRTLERALELSGVSVWHLDLASQRVRFNTVGFDVVHMVPDAEGVPLQTLRESIHPDDLGPVIAAADAAQRSDGVVDVVARYRTSEGRWRRLLTRRVAERDETGRPIGLLGVSLDLTEREAERAQAELLAEQSGIVAQAMGAGFWRRDGDSQAVLWDAAMYRLYARDPARAPPTMHEWVDEYVLPAAREAARQTLLADIAAWAPTTLMTVPVRADDGTERWVRAWTRRHDRDGQRYAMGMHLDVTDQQRHEAVQREAERAARASREKSAFMALMSHRLRTPLNAVLGFAQVMAQDLAEPLSVRQRERLARIDAAGSELLAMIDDVFEVAGLDADALPPSRVPVPLQAVITQLREAVEPLARQRGVRLTIPEVPADLPVATDRRLLGQALLHLVAHAVRRNERGGWVALELQPGAEACRLELRDGGPLLTPRQRELLFDATALPTPAAGTGDALVGLDLVRQALERLGAQLHWLHPDASDSGLVVLLPRPAGGAAARAPRAFTLLCVEDNPVNLMLVQELVAMRPAIRFFCAEDGASGLALAAAERPDVVLLDLHLPDIDGLEVLTRLRADPALVGCRVIALSANALPEDIRAARAEGFDDYWTKPIDFDQFLAGLDALASTGPTAPAAP